MGVGEVRAKRREVMQLYVKYIKIIFNYGTDSESDFFLKET